MNRPHGYGVLPSLMMLLWLVIAGCNGSSGEEHEATTGADTSEVSTSSDATSSDAVDSSGGTGATGASETTTGASETTTGASETTAGLEPPAAPVLTLGFSQIKRFDFSWAADPAADYYQLEQSVAPGEPFVQLGGDIVGNTVSHVMPLCFRYEASYRLRACNVVGCTDSAVLGVMSSLVEAVGYVKASNTGPNDYFGYSVALSGDGHTLAVGASNEDSNSTGIDGDQANDLAYDSGAVYVFVRDGMGAWSQQAYVKASNTDNSDNFGGRVAMSADGNTLAVGASNEDSVASFSGAVYVFVRDGLGEWSQQAHVKASNAGFSDSFGGSVALSGDGNTLAVGASNEDSNSTGIDGDQTNDADYDSGAVYVFVRDGMGEWSQQAYVKASNTGWSDGFGTAVALSGNGNSLVVGAGGESSNGTGIDGDQTDDSASFSGAVYVLVRDGMGEWSQQAYLKASNTASSDNFGGSVAMSEDGSIVAVAAAFEDSNADGIGGDQANDLASASGAVYVFVRDGMGEWSQQAYVKAPNPGADDRFGYQQRVVLSGDGNTLAVGSYFEDSSSTGIGGNLGDNSTADAGAVYLY